MTNPYNFFDGANKYFGQKYGQRCSISTINYSASSQTPVVRDYSKYYLETVTDQYSNTAMADAEFFRVDGNKTKIAPGDLLHCTRETGYSNIPDVTILSFNRLGACMAIKTTRVGAIYNGFDPIYTDIRFDYLPRSSFPGQPLNREIATSLGIPTVQAVMFNRDLWTPIRDAEGLYLYQTDVTPNIVWTIISVTQCKLDEDSEALLLTLKRETT